MANFTRDQLRNCIAGPVYPLLTPFTSDGSQVDLGALERYVKFLVGASAGTIMTTVGTSRFNLLSDDEMMSVNETVVNASSDTTITIVAGPMTGNLRSNIRFAEHADNIGADAYIAYYPERWYSDDDIYGFFKDISEAVSVGVMIHEMPMRNGYGGQMQYSLPLLEKLVELPGVVGLKEECMDAGYSYKVHRRLQNKCAIIGAGAMRNFMRDFHAGAIANLAGIGNFFPRVETAFQESLKNGDFSRAHDIVRKYEDPYFDVAVELGWHPQLKETLNMFDLLPAFERKPLSRLDSEKRKRLRKCIESLGWDKLSPDHIPD